VNSKVVLWTAIAIGTLLPGCARTPAEREASFLNRGKALLEKNDPNRALLEFRNAIAAMPHDAEAYYQLALTYAQLKDPSQAGAALQKAIELNPKHAGARLGIAQMMASSSYRGAVEEARKRLDSMLGETPGDVEILNALALTEARLGELSDAQSHIEQALAKAPAELKSSVLLARLQLSQGKSAAAEQTLQQAVSQAPRSVDSRLALARFYLETRKTGDAETEIRRALQLDSKNGIAWRTLGAIQLSRGDKAGAAETYRQLSQLPDKSYRWDYAMYLFQDGQRDAAISEFERIARKDPNDRDARTRLVSGYIGVNRLSDAEKLLTAALKSHGNDADALYQRSLLFLGSGKYEDAKNDLMRVVRLNPESANARYALSRAEAGLGSPTQQRAHLEAALQLDPNLLSARVSLSRALITAGQASSAIDLMNRTPESQRSSLPARVARIWAQLASGDQASARKELDEALAIARTPELLQQDSVLKSAQKNYSGARASLEEILKATPDDVEVWGALAQTYYAEKQLPKAAERLRTAVAQRPNSAPLHYILAQVLLAEDKRKEAALALAGAIGADPQFVAADLMLAGIEKEDGDIDSARRRLTAVLARTPKHVPAMLLLGDLEIAAGNRPGAIAQYRAIVESDQTNTAALNNLAYLLAKEDPDAALRYGEKAAELMPENASVQDTMGWIYYRRGLYEVAVRHLRTAVAQGATPLHKYHLALAYLKAGDRAKGEPLLQAALQADPKLAKTEADW
jgi:tetratricopeptide (TPR) repeat protein